MSFRFLIRLDSSILVKAWGPELVALVFFLGPGLCARSFITHIMTALPTAAWGAENMEGNPTRCMFVFAYSPLVTFGISGFWLFFFFLMSGGQRGNNGQGYYGPQDGLYKETPRTRVLLAWANWLYTRGNRRRRKSNRLRWAGRMVAGP